MAAWMSTSAGTAASAVPDNMLKMHSLSPPRNPIRAAGNREFCSGAVMEIETASDVVCHLKSWLLQCAPRGAFHQWREVPFRELSIALVADERFGWVTGWIEAS